jgi:hypothetical protein
LRVGRQRRIGHLDHATLARLRALKEACRPAGSLFAMLGAAP